MPSNTSVRLARRPSGTPVPDDFAITTEAAPEPGPKEFVVKNTMISLDPAMRGWLDDRPSYLPPVGIGEVVRAGAVGEVVASQHRRFPVGSYVSGTFGVQEYALSDGRDVTKIDLAQGTPAMHLGVLGLTGLTAYFGLFDLGKPRAGETVLVSAAAGAVGSIVGQLALLNGCRVVGLAGGPEKCRYLTEELGFHAAIDYKADGMRRAMAEACPDGIDVYFDNVGGTILNTALTMLAMHARIVVCGAVAQYNADAPTPGPSNYLALLVRRATMSGFLVFDYASEYPVARRRLAGWVADGRITAPETIVAGSVSDFLPTFMRLFSGDNLGKLVLDISG
ncbi:MAG: NADP-dependent oxidoreductase [Actinomycetota bacterium]|nr:NADP-dependent oxidoreductase [Actinomycetota bacterium]